MELRDFTLASFRNRYRYVRGNLHHHHRVKRSLSLTGAGSRLVSGFVGGLRPLSDGEVLLVRGRVPGPPVNTVGIRSPVRAFKVTIKHAGGAPFIFTTFALLTAGARPHPRRLHVQGAALRVVVHEGAHGGGHGALVLRARRRRHRVGGAVLGGRRREGEDVVGLGGRRARRLRLVGIAAAEGHPRPGVAQRLGPVRQPGGQRRVEVRPADLGGGHPRRCNRNDNKQTRFKRKL